MIARLRAPSAAARRIEPTSRRFPRRVRAWRADVRGWRGRRGRRGSRSPIPAIPRTTQSSSEKTLRCRYVSPGEQVGLLDAHGVGDDERDDDDDAAQDDVAEQADQPDHRDREAEHEEEQEQRNVGDIGEREGEQARDDGQRGKGEHARQRRTRGDATVRAAGGDPGANEGRDRLVVPLRAIDDEESPPAVAQRNRPPLRIVGGAEAAVPAESGDLPARRDQASPHRPRPSCEDPGDDGQPVDGSRGPVDELAADVVVGDGEPEAHVAAVDQGHGQKADSEQALRDRPEDREDREDRVPVTLHREQHADERAGDEGRDARTPRTCCRPRRGWPARELRSPS